MSVLTQVIAVGSGLLTNSGTLLDLYGVLLISAGIINATLALVNSVPDVIHYMSNREKVDILNPKIIKMAHKNVMKVLIGIGCLIVGLSIRWIGHWIATSHTLKNLVPT